MRTANRNESDLVLAAQAGDPRALDDLVAAGLPLAYSIVRRALDGHSDADDAVQDTVLPARRRGGGHHPARGADLSRVVRPRRGDQLWVDQANGTPAFWAENSFRVRPALVG
ncbi:hypothetical protein [Dactylosporangium sp. NPDC005555]|uniref:RNA polymerase sigma factor n=1 Tax=Dactylosporangium sp. NPDC005555 TaxID=3154889 RepID=UPI0033AB06EF